MQKNVFRASIGGLLLALGVLGTFSVCQAETCKLKLVTETPKASKENRKKYPSSYVFQGNPQDFIKRVSSQQKQVDPKDDPKLKEFLELVKKEPTYVSKHPLKGVLRFGGKRFAFAFDTIPEKEAPEKEAKEEETGSVFNAHFPVSYTDTDKKPAVAALNRLYLDFNGNGDLTDDKPIERKGLDSNGDLTGDKSTKKKGLIGSKGFRHDINRSRDAQSIFEFVFSSEQDGVTVEIPCRFNTKTTTFRQVIPPRSNHELKTFEIHNSFVRFFTNGFREGEIKLGNKTFRVILIDYNNNGTFNDVAKKFTFGRGCKTGDIAYVFPTDMDAPNFSPSPTGSQEGRVALRLIGPIIGAIDGKYWNLDLTTLGDQLTLTPFDKTLGYLTKAGQQFSICAFNNEKKSFISFSSNEEGKATLPPGKWRLRICRSSFEGEKAAQSAEESEEALQKEATEKTDNVTRGTVTSTMGNRPGATHEITENETTELKCGAPYKVVVTSSVRSGQKNKGQVVRLLMVMTGAMGGRCINVSVDGKRPPKPTFVITTKDGKVVESGAFDYG